MPVRPENALFDPAAGRRTILQQDGVQIHTMEHLLAAVAGLGDRQPGDRDHARMEIPEPADGSAAPIATLLLEAGIVEQDRPQRHIKVTKPVHWQRERRARSSAVPYHGFRITFTIDYDHPLVGRQTLLARHRRPRRSCARSRRAHVRARARPRGAAPGAAGSRAGGSRRAVVVGERRILNPEPLRFPDEFVRHKILDLLGDLFAARRAAARARHRASARATRATSRSCTTSSETLPLPGRRAGRTARRVGHHRDHGHHAAPLSVPAGRPHHRASRKAAAIEGIKNVTINEPFFQGHFPGHPIMPGGADHRGDGAGRRAAAAQLGRRSRPSKLMYFMGIDGARFRRPVTPGDQLRFTLTLLKLKGRPPRCSGEAYVDDQLVAEAELLAHGRRAAAVMTHRHPSRGLRRRRAPSSAPA